MTRPTIAVVGDVILDRDVDGTVTRLCPDAPVPVVDVAEVRHSPGGAGLAALLCAQHADVVLVAPVADDDAGSELRRALAGVRLVALGHDGPTRRKTRVRSSGQSLVRVDDGGPGTPVAVEPDRVREALRDCDAVLVADYGAGVTHDPVLRAALEEAAASVPLVWDPHPRGGPPVRGAALVTPNLAEASAEAERLGLAVQPAASGAGLAAALRVAWKAGAVSVTAGDRGAFVAVDPTGATSHDGGPADVVSHVPTTPAIGGDSCGAGDRFAATAASRLARGDSPQAAVREAVAAASAWVAAGGADGFRRALAPEHGPAPAGAQGSVPGSADDGLAALGRRLRALGGTLVATGGCFDLLHAGHVTTLEAARALGDQLVVLVNSDRSVRRLKGPGRPVVPAADRVRVLEALDCVDAAVVFDDDDPSAALAALRPDVWAKGGDYAGRELPESAVVREHGGRTVLLPYLDGLSTTALLDRARGSRPGRIAVDERSRA